MVDRIATRARAGLGLAAVLLAACLAGCGGSGGAAEAPTAVVVM